MRAIFVLLTILSLATPAGSWNVARELSPLTASSMTLATSAPFTSQLIRAIAKAEKTFGFGCALAHASSIDLEPVEYTRHDTTDASEPPNLSLDCPPLAPRPPPLD